jgi:hypothetical protein
MLDDLINEVARDMTAASPRNDLAPRVMVRVDEVAVGRMRAQWSHGWITVGVAAALAMLAIIVISRRAPPPLPAITPVVSRQSVPVAAGQPPVVASSAPSGRRAQRVAPPPAIPSDVAPLLLQPIDSGSVVVTRLGGTAPIETDPAAIDRLEVPALQ